MTEAKYVNPSYLVQDRRSMDPNLLTHLQISELAGVSGNTVTKWAQIAAEERRTPGSHPGLDIMPEAAHRIPRWNMPLYDKREIIEWLVRTSRLVPSPDA